MNMDIWVNINEQSATTVRVSGESPVILTFYEKYWDENLLVSGLNIVGHSPLSVAAWFNVLDVTMAKVKNYPFLEEYAILTPMPPVPDLVVDVNKRFSKPTVQTAKLREIYWPNSIPSETVHLAERVELHPLKPFLKPPTNKLITQRANESLKAITRSGAWRVIRNGMLAKQRCITYTNFGL